MGFESAGDRAEPVSVDEAPTRVDAPHAGTPVSRGTPNASNSLGSSLLTTDALRTERFTQRRSALLASSLVAGIAALALQISDFRSKTHWVLTAILGVTSAVSGAAWVSARQDERGFVLNPTSVGVLVVLTALAGIAHAGAVSAVVATLPLIIYYFALGDSPERAMRLFLLSALGYALIVALSATGTLPLGESLVSRIVAHARAREVLVFAGVVEAILVAAFFMARRSRQATLHAMEQLETARRRIQLRDALLNEVRADFDRAAEAGRVGRLTGVRIGPWLAGDVIGRGGMGEIYEARHAESSEPAALKVLHAFMLDQPQHVERFFRETRVSSELDSPHIVEVIDSGRADDGSPYLAMELLEGTDLARYLREHKRMRMRDALELVSHVSQALAVAHDAGIVHRDLKPQNLFKAKPSDGEACWKVLDFGVSKIAEAGATLTHGAAVGTPSYMSPEQARGGSVDGRSDVFSLGVVAYRVLTGRPPFTAPDALATMYQVMHVQPVRPDDFMSEHEDVGLVLALALAKDTRRRFGTATAFAAALADAARGRLDTRFREAALALLQREPWGAELTRS